MASLNVNVNNRRQPSRTSRNARPINFYAKSFGAPTNEEPTAEEPAPGFFPAITHFTDAVDALPREIMRHFGLMKEVEAKLVAPEEELARAGKRILGMVREPAWKEDDHHHASVQTLKQGEAIVQEKGGEEATGSGNTAVTMNSDASSKANNVTASAVKPSINEQGAALEYLLRGMLDMGHILDEKIAVLSNTNFELNSQLERMQSSYDYIPHEISDEARLGSSTHWAFITEKDIPPKKTGTERARREAAAANVYAGGGAAALQELDSRAESRGMLGGRKKQAHLDSDFEERPSSRKANAKGKKSAAAAASVEVDARGGAANSHAGPGPGAKKKKPAASSNAQQSDGKAPLAGTFTVTKQRMAGSPMPEPTAGKKRKNPPGTLAGGRKKVTATNDPRSSPRMPFSSPVMGTFTTTKENNQGRPSHARGRHGGSSASNAHGGARPASASAIPPGSSAGGMVMEIDPSSPLLQPSLNNSSTSLNNRAGPSAEGLVSRPGGLERNLTGTSIQSDSVAGDGIPLPQQVVTTRIGRVSKAATPITSTFPEISKPTLSRAKSGNGNGQHEDSNGNGNGGSHPSSESGAPSRISTRDKRRVKKDSRGSPASSRAGSTAGGVAAPEPAANPADTVEDGDVTLEEIKPDSNTSMAVAENVTDKSAIATSAAAPPHSTKSLSRLASSTPQASPAIKPSASKKAVPELEPDEDDEEDLEPEDEDLEDADDEGDGEIDDEEPRYCYCDGVSYGSMVACDNEECSKQWFHLKCAGLKVEPKKEETWFCDTCKEMGFGVEEEGGSKRKKSVGKGKKK